MIIKKSNNDYKDLARKIWENNFDDEKDYIDFYFNNIYNNDNFVFLEDDKGNILSSLHEIKDKIILNNNKFTTNYIVGVATDIIYRGQGYMTRLLKSSLNEAYKKEMPLVFLKAINPSIYRKFNFEYFSSIEVYDFDIDCLRNFKFNKSFKVEYINEDNGNLFLQDFKTIYDISMKSFDIFLNRELIDFENLIKECKADGSEILLLYYEDVPMSYIIYSKEKDTIYIREIMARDIYAKKSLLALIYTYREYYSKCKVLEKKASNFQFLFDNQLEIKKGIELFAMGRITNVKKILEILNLGVEDIAIYIVDDIIKENKAVYYLDEERRIETYPYNYDVKIDIGSFTALVLGYFSIDELIELNKIELVFADKLNILKKLFPKKKSYILSYV